METCITPGCTNARDHNRRICNVCRNRQRGEAAKRKRRSNIYGPCNPACPGWQRCTEGRLWLDRLPCETLLPFEVGVEFDTGDLTLWRMPLLVMDVDAI
jgi:hypothetical protein